MCRLVLRSILFASLVACRSSPPSGGPSSPPPDAKPAANPPSGLAASPSSGQAVFERIAWAPADTSVLAWWWTKTDPIFIQGTQLFNGREPACFAELRAKTPMRWTLQRDLSDQPVNVFATGMARAEIEACLRTMSGLAGKQAQTVRDGGITKLSSGEWSTFLGFARDGYVLWHDDRARVAELMSWTGTTLRGDAVMQDLVMRADPAAAGGWASTVDLGAAAVGTRSLGLMTNTAGLPDGGTLLRGVVVFGNDADARRAVETVASLARDAKDVRERPVWRALHPVAKGRDVEVDFSVIAEKETMTFMGERLRLLRDGG